MKSDTRKIQVEELKYTCYGNCIMLKIARQLKYNLCLHCQHIVYVKKRTCMPKVKIWSMARFYLFIFLPTCSSFMSTFIRHETR